MVPPLPRRQAVVDDMYLQEFQEDDRQPAEAIKWAPNLVWREKVVQWSYDVADHLNEERSVVYVAINILDRYCASKNRKMDEKSYEIASLSSIFLAVRISGSGNLLIAELVSMSRGGITTQDIISTGTDIVRELRWEYKIITPSDFVKSFLNLVPSRTCGNLDQASYFTEIAVCDVVLSHSKASFLAIAACLNVLRTELPCTVPGFVEAVWETTAIDANSEDIQALCARLEVVFSRSVGEDSQHDQVLDGRNNVESEKDCGPHIIEDDYDEQEEDETPKALSGNDTSRGMGTKRTSCDSLDTLCPEVAQEEKRVKLGM